MDTDNSSHCSSDFSDDSSTRTGGERATEEPSITDETSSQSLSTEDEDSSSDGSVESSFTDNYQRELSELQARRHPRCIYENISTRDLCAQVKSQLPGLTQRLRILLSDALAKVYAVHEMRRSSPLRHRQRVFQDQWEYLLNMEYRRHARAALEAMEADVAYFREILREMLGNQDSVNDPDGILQEEVNRIHEEIGDTRANILVHRLRGGVIMGRFLDAFRDSRSISEEEWEYADSFIALYRTPSSRGISSHQSWVLEYTIDQDQLEQYQQLLQRSGVDDQSPWWYEHLVPRCLAKYLDYIFGEKEMDAIDDPANMIPSLQLEWSQALVPVLDHDTGFTPKDSEHIKKRPLPAGSEQWLHAGFFEEECFDASSRRSSVHEFSTGKGSPKPPNRSFAFFRALLASFASMRWQGSTSWTEYVAQQEWLAQERWCQPNAPWIRKSTMVRLASTVGLVDPDEFVSFWVSRVEHSTGHASIGDDDNDEKDILIADIVDELIFHSPDVWIEQEELERLRLRETDIVAVMQRRRDPQHSHQDPDW